MIDEESRKQINRQLDLVLENLTDTETKLKSMLTNFRQAVEGFRRAIK
jgi:methionine synthase II (cobalamin-independent)